MSVGRILVVDDVPELGKALSEALGRWFRDATIVVDQDPSRALERVRAERFDLILSDLRMPNVDGLSLLALARAQQPNAKRVLMTGYREIPMASDRVAAASLDALVLKPVHVQDLVLLLGDLLHGSATDIMQHRAAAAAYLAHAPG